MAETIDFTEAELRQFSPKMRDGYRLALVAGKEVLRSAGILDNGKRLSHFLGQFGAETGGGTIGRESLTYSSVARIRQVWPARAKKETEAVLQGLVRNPVALGDWAYGGRMGNRKGTTDGYDYRGGGFLQTTGRAAVQDYCEKCGLEIRADILDDCDATLKFACFEWKESGCNELADENNLLGVSKAINTGSATSNIVPNGMENRQEWFGKAKAIWWDAESVPSIQPENTADEPTQAQQHAAVHAQLSDESWMYYANRWNLKALSGAAVVFWGFLKDNSILVVATIVVAIALFEAAQYAQRQKKIKS